MNLSVLSATLPPDLVNLLVAEYQRLHEKYYLGQWAASELNGGRLGEIVLRILEYKNTGQFTAIGILPDRERIINSIRQNTSLPTEMRHTIPRITAVLIDIRNSRNVAHVGLIAVNAMDASFVISMANWILAELVRTEAHISPEEAEQEVLKLIERKVPVIEEIGNRLRILNPNLSVRHRILICAYQKYPTPITEEDLWNWTEDTNRSRFRAYLSELHSDGELDYHDGFIRLTKKGLKFVEEKIDFHL